MQVSGFTFIRNAQLYDYPVVEAITSILPMCNELVVAVGNSQDETRALIEGINSPKIKIIDTVWDDTLRQGGQVLAIETNKALQAVNPTAHWAFYIQADEILHESSIPALQQALERYKDDKSVEGLLFDYKHFYGSYDYVAQSRRWYRHEVRVVRPWPTVTSYKDAQGFRIDNRKLKVKPSGGLIHHYGWVKPPQQQQAKQKAFHSLWHNDDKVQQMIGTADSFDYKLIDELQRYTGQHPAVMQERINHVNWQFNYDPTQALQPKLKYRIANAIERLTGQRIGEYKNYTLV